MQSRGYRPALPLEGRSVDFGLVETSCMGGLLYTSTWPGGYITSIHIINIINHCDVHLSFIARRGPSYHDSPGLLLVDDTVLNPRM